MTRHAPDAPAVAVALLEIEAPLGIREQRQPAYHPHNAMRRPEHDAEVVCRTTTGNRESMEDMADHLGGNG